MFNAGEYSGDVFNAGEYCGDVFNAGEFCSTLVMCLLLESSAALW